MSRGSLVGDPVGMLFCHHDDELDETAAELCGRLLEPGRGVRSPDDVSGIVVTLQERLAAIASRGRGGSTA